MIIWLDDGRNPFRGCLKILIAGFLIWGAVWVLPWALALALYAFTR